MSHNQDGESLDNQDSLDYQEDTELSKEENLTLRSKVLALSGFQRPTQGLLSSSSQLTYYRYSLIPHLVD